MVSTIDDARTPAELAEWLRVWADAYEEEVDYLDDNDAQQLAEAVERVSLPGNVAALRAALEELRDAERDFWHQILNSKYSVILDKYTATEQGFPAVHAVKRAGIRANYALSAPRRNCDRFQTKDEAVKAWTTELLTISDTPQFGDWLFAPAREELLS